MKKTHIILISFLTVLLCACNNTQQKETSETKTKNKEQRIVSLNGAITEIIFELDHGAEVVGRDVTSTYPEWIKDSIKDLGHVRSLNIESLAALKPTLILASSNDLNSDLLRSIEGLDLNFKLFDQEFTAEGTKKLINEVADFIGDKETESLINKIDSDLDKVESFESKPKVLFIYARGAGTMMVAGEGTPMESIIELAGGQNAVQGIKDFKPLTEEALLSSNPDVILLFDSGLESLGGKEGLLKSTPGVSQTNAGKNKAIIAMDGGLISDFGPRVGEAAYELNKLLREYAE